MKTTYKAVRLDVRVSNMVEQSKPNLGLTWCIKIPMNALEDAITEYRMENSRKSSQ
jgi:hypothetical protein